MSSCMMSHDGPHAVCTIVLTNCFKKRAKMLGPVFCHRGTIMESSRIDPPHWCQQYFKEGKTETSSRLWQTSQINLPKHERRCLTFSFKVGCESNKRLKTNPRADLVRVNKVSVWYLQPLGICLLFCIKMSMNKTHKGRASLSRELTETQLFSSSLPSLFRLVIFLLAWQYLILARRHLTVIKPPSMNHLLRIWQLTPCSP